ncbi:FCD domain-containing protein [Devosia epidermidihirudinis]|uniref:FCD domain-containing protein n=1 Tax=Devosia epidermidihirudinis TaxID=1293439 RepID=UPI0009E64311|nr:FCD domain-containing protein [Devosia epidermidihirudinis]
MSIAAHTSPRFTAFGDVDSIFGRPKNRNLTPNGGLWLQSGATSLEGDMAAVDGAEIARLIAEDVHSGVLQPGDMIPSERDLCVRFNVGRTAVREALTTLEAMNLISQQKGFRPRVLAPTLSHVMAGAAEAVGYFFRDGEGMAHLEQARLFLETSMVRYAAQHVTTAQIARLIAAIEAGDAAIDDATAFRNADVLFHRVLAEIPGNPIFVALHDTFVDRLMRGRAAPPDVQGHNRRINDEHKAITQALVAKDADAAVAALTRHLTRNYTVYVHNALTPVGGRASTTSMSD